MNNFGGFLRCKKHSYWESEYGYALLKGDSTYKALP